MSFLQTYLVIFPCITTIEPHRPINIQCMLKLCVVCCFSSIQQSLLCRHSWHRFIFLQNPVQLRSLESVFSFLIKFRMRQCDIVLVAWFFFFFFLFVRIHTQLCKRPHFQQWHHTIQYCYCGRLLDVSSSVGGMLVAPERRSSSPGLIRAAFNTNVGDVIYCSSSDGCFWTATAVNCLANIALSAALQ